jgi:hypothetical protein
MTNNRRAAIEWGDLRCHEMQRILEPRGIEVIYLPDRMRRGIGVVECQIMAGRGHKGHLLNRLKPQRP